MSFLYDVIYSTLVTFIIGCSIMILYLKVAGYKKINPVYEESLQIWKSEKTENK